MTPTLVAQIVRKVLHETPTHIEPIVGLGFVNAVFRVETRAGSFVLRLNSDAGLDVFHKEAWCIQQATALGIPSPTIIDYGEIPGAIYMVQALIDGENGTRCAGDPQILWRRMGEYARLFHAVPVVGFGETLVEPAEKRFGATWAQFVHYNLDSLHANDELRRLNVLTPASSDKLRVTFEMLLDAPLTFGLNHGDLSAKNVMLHPGGDVYLLDWGSAEAHIVPHFDLFALHQSGILAGSPEHQAFLQGYGLAEAEYQRIQPELDALLLLTFVDKLRWAIDRQPALIDEFAARARQAVATLIKPSPASS